MAKNNGWISIKDRLPDNQESVLVCALVLNDACYYTVGNYVFNKKKNTGYWEVETYMLSDSDEDYINIYFDDNNPEGKITHWKKIHPPKV